MTTYDGQDILGPDSDPICSTCRVDDDIDLNLWEDYKNYRKAPVWSSVFFPEVSFYGLGVVQAFYWSTGITIDCPITAQRFAQSISWESWENWKDRVRQND